MVHLRPRLAGAVEDAWCAAWASLAYDAKTNVLETPELVRVLTPGSADFLLNAIVRLHDQQPLAPAGLAEQLAPFYAMRRAMQWWLRWDTSPAQLREQLSAIGMRPWDRPPGMALAFSAWQGASPLPGELTVRPVTTTAEAEHALAIICEVFGTDPVPMRHWCIDNPHFVVMLATLNEQPAGALAFQVRDGVAGVFHVATLPQWRRRGVAYAMVGQSLRMARDLGANVAALTSSAMAIPLYRSLGFREAGQYEFWIPGPRLMLALERGQE